MAAGDVYERIYAAAEPYWEARENQVHLPVSYAFAKELLAAYPEADEAIVLPAILLHDVGYSEVPPDVRLRGLAGAPIGWEPDATRRHEIAGARIAGELLADLGYDEERTLVIQEIIDGHDSNVEAISVDDAIVKDADKLWRFSESGIRSSSGWMSMTVEAFIEYVESKIDEWLLTPRGKELARETLAQSRAALETAQGG
jgi:hypothetical protein